MDEKEIALAAEANGQTPEQYKKTVLDQTPPPGWEVPEMYRASRYDVGLFRDHPDGSRTSVFWAVDVDMVRATEAVTEMLIMKEKAPDAFAGDVVIRPTEPIVVRRFQYGQCKADGADSGSGGQRHLQSVGRIGPADSPKSGRKEEDVNCMICNEDHYTRDHEQVTRKRIEAFEALRGTVQREYP